MIISKLPNWVLVNKFPAFYDTESLTAVEQTARVYGKINELIESYNKYVEEINKAINDIATEKDEDVKAFICRISCLTDNYINTVDMKIAHQDRQIAEVYTRFKDDVVNTIKLMISDLKESGELDNAILTALDNINTKVDEFIAAGEQLKTELAADYQNTKAALDSDYETVKGNLETDYAGKKAALDSDYETVKGNLETDYAGKKAALDSDYETVKGNLETDYAGKKAALETDYNNTKSALNSDMAGLIDDLGGLPEKVGKVFYEVANDSAVDLFGMSFPGIENYHIVNINVPFGSAVCSVHNNTVNVGTDEETRYTYITGFGAIYSPATSGDLVYIKITLMGDTVSKCNTYILDNGYILSDGSSEEEPLNTPTTYYFNKTYPTKIVGII